MPLVHITGRWGKDRVEGVVRRGHKDSIITMPGLCRVEPFRDAKMVEPLFTKGDCLAEFGGDRGVLDRGGFFTDVNAAIICV